MKKTAFCALAAILAASASAASAKPASTAYDWTGIYAGVGVGGLSDQSNWSFPSNGETTAPPFSQGGPSVHVGVQKQFGGWTNGGFVLGLDTSASFMSDFNGGAFCPNSFFTCQAKIDDLFTAGGKLGVGLGPILLYGSGGWAGGNVKTQAYGPGFPAYEPTSAWQQGWYLGFGADWMFRRTTGVDWLLGAEYQHVDLGSALHVPAVNSVVDARNVNVSADYVKAKLTLKFN